MSKFKKFRKIPVIIEAYQTDEKMEIETLEGTMKADKGDWIIKGVKGELYPCKPDVFEMTYEKVTENERTDGCHNCKYGFFDFCEKTSEHIDMYFQETMGESMCDFDYWEPEE